MTNDAFDFAVIGGGVVGLAIARQIAIESPSARIVVLEKESTLAAHASGRNSGVLHAGFYYAPDSLKARLTRVGNVLLHEFLNQRSIPVRKTGKVVVATSVTQLDALDELARRGQANDVPLDVVSSKDLATIEPTAHTVERAIWSPTTSVADPVAVVEALAADARERGVTIRLNTPVESAEPGLIRTEQGYVAATHIVNAAGLYCDRVARWFGMAGNYMMLPFKGLYWYSTRSLPMQRHVYPVPDPRNPFLGVHTTVTVDGRVKIGPTAIPALWRESYGGIAGFKWDEFASCASTFPHLLFSKHHNMFATVRQELPKYSRRVLVAKAAELVPGLRASDFTQRGRVGVRAQLFDTARGALEMDFVIRGDVHSTHMLNSVSPAWTSCLAVAQHTTADMRGRGVL